MTDLSSENIYRVFRELLDEAPDPLRSEIQSLLDRAKAGQKTDNQLLRLARRDPAFLQRVSTRLGMVDGTRVYSDLAGSIESTPALHYVCPKCEKVYILGEVGEDPGKCPTCHEVLIPREQKGR